MRFFTTFSSFFKAAAENAIPAVGMEVPKMADKINSTDYAKQHPKTILANIKFKPLSSHQNADKNGSNISTK